MPDPTNTDAERQRGWTPLDSCTVQSISVWDDGEHKLLWEARPMTLGDRVPRMAIETTMGSDPAPAIDVQASEITPPTSLVNRVANAIYSAPHNSEAEARAAIREVAAWIDERDSRAQNEPDCLEAPFADDAVGWLRDELTR